MKVKFLTTRVVDDARKGTKNEERFEEGKVYDLPEPSARRWVDRKVAELLAGEPPLKPVDVLADLPKGRDKKKG
ncbi:MAG: hypothetical protein Rhirs2KO_18390 [Rhizobiaceae bacterium]